MCKPFPENGRGLFYGKDVLDMKLFRWNKLSGRILAGAFVLLVLAAAGCGREASEPSCSIEVLEGLPQATGNPEAMPTYAPDHASGAAGTDAPTGGSTPGDTTGGSGTLGGDSTSGSGTSADNTTNGSGTPRQSVPAPPAATRQSVLLPPAATQPMAPARQAATPQPDLILLAAAMTQPL